MRRAAHSRRRRMPCAVAPVTINADGAPPIAAIDWLAREAANPASRFTIKR
jgi:hypothetical protein